MKFTVIKNGFNQLSEYIISEIVNECFKNGDQISESDSDLNYVLNFTSVDNPIPFRRKSRSVFVISIIADALPTEEIRSVSYNTLIGTLSNLLIYVSPNSKTYFTTPEAGFYQIDYEPQDVYEKIYPIISSQFASDNEFITDLPLKYWGGSKITTQLSEYGKYMDKMGVLPTPFPLRKILNEEQLNHLYKIFGITGASYGNLSAREDIPELGSSTFWMTGRGVDKSKLHRIGQDILLVKNFDFKNGTAIISMPQIYNPRARVSVDAVEHALIYKTFPQVKAIVHMHAWMEEIICTHQNYPCGTVELAREVVKMLNQTETPGCAVVGLKNHGLTITGNSLEEIFNRISDKLLTEVEMVA